MRPLIEGKKRKGSKAGLVCKLDIEKTYDHLSRTFLHSVLENVSFGHKWRKWVHLCISTLKMLVLVNGTPIDFF